MTKPFYNVDPDHLARFDSKLKRLLDAEIAAGNSIVETGSGWPKPHSVIVRLRNPFTVAHELKPADVEYRLINDPHWWKDEFDSNDHLLTVGM